MLIIVRPAWQPTFVFDSFLFKTNPVSLSYVSSYKEIDVLLVYVLVIPFSFQRAILCALFFGACKIISPHLLLCQQENEFF